MPQPSIATETALSPDTTYRLRDYQQQVIDEVWQLWASRSAQKILLQLPTGAGKTVVFATIAHRFTERGAPVLVLAHREELLLQAKEKLESVTGERVGLIKAGYREDRDAPIQVASVASLLNRQLPPASLVVVDEAHHSTALTYTQLFEQFPEASILGVTATPVRSDGRGFREIYDRLVVGPAVSWLIDREYLSRYRLFAAPKTVDTTGVGKMGGDYNPRQLAKAVSTSLTMGDSIDAWQRFAQGKKTVIFAVNVEHSKAIAAAYRTAGIAAEHLDGSIKDADRRAVLDRFRAGETLVLSNCGLFSEGFDVPSIEAVQCIRPTKSLALWLQIVGRSLRPSPGKDAAIVIDHTENWVAHGLPDRPFSWSLDAIDGDSERWGVMCPHCRSTFRPEPDAQTPGSFEWSSPHQEFRSITYYTCPNCGGVMEMEQWQGRGEPPEPREIDADREAEIWEIPTDCNVEILADLFRLVGFQRQVKRHVTLNWLFERLTRSHSVLGVPELRECARLAGMDDRWALDWARQTVAERWPEQLVAAVPEISEATDAGRDRVGDGFEALTRSSGELRINEPQTGEPLSEELLPEVALETQAPTENPATETGAIVPVSPHDIVRAIAARREAATRHASGNISDGTPDDASDEIIDLEIVDRPSPESSALPKLPELRVPTVPSAATTSRTDVPRTWERQLQGELGLWWARTTVTPDLRGWRTRVEYRAPNGRSFEEQVAGYFPDRDRQGIAELERRWRPSRRARRGRPARDRRAASHTKSDLAKRVLE